MREEKLEKRREQVPYCGGKTFPEIVSRWELVTAIITSMIPSGSLMYRGM